MAENVYIIPQCLVASALYSDQHRMAVETAADGEPIGANEIASRVYVTISGEVTDRTYAEAAIFLNRMRGGIGIAGVIDFNMRAWMKADLVPAINSSGSEFWRANGRTSGYAGESANPPTGPYRSINASVVGAHSAGDTTIDVDGLLDSETLDKGLMVRFGDWRYMLASSVTANASGEATLTLDQGIREALSDNDPARVPGDFMLMRMQPGANLGNLNADGFGTFSFEFREVYSDEVSGGLGTYVLP